MKADIHPTYFPKAKVKCACGASFVMGATKPEIQMEICSNCHPFYTGEQKLIDTAGRVDRFKNRLTKASATPKVKKVRMKKNPNALNAVGVPAALSRKAKAKKK